MEKFLRNVSSNNVCIALGKTQNVENKKPWYQHWKIGLKCHPGSLDKVKTKTNKRLLGFD